jgi:16S rRNA (cytosine967-C5)-methyltransferase
LARSAISSADRGLCQELVYGVVRWQGTLDWLIARKASGAPKPLLQILLRLGLYQIFWLDRIPNHAAVNETVEVAKRKGLKSQAGFVNAVLRGYLREHDATRALLEDLKKTDPALAHSHPQWLFQRWRRLWGEDPAIKLMEWNNQPPKTYARTNTLQTDAAKLLPMWREENVDYDFFSRPWCEENLVFLLKSHPPLAHLGSFRQGLFYLQDPSTLLAVRQLDAQAGEAILDVCAAPGGKLTYIAQLLRNEGKVLAHDMNSERLELIRENCARLGVTCVHTVRPNELTALPPSTLDRVLVDAPCSNTGVMRRRVELRWRLNEDEICRLQSAQLELLGRMAQLLKPGGTLVYSTCSLEPEENENVISDFLESQPGVHEISRHQLLPWVDGVDGAFVVSLRRG